MKRRNFCKLLAGTGLTAATPNLFAAPTSYDGPIFVQIQATGGWDVTSFCDPKAQSYNKWANGGADTNEAINDRWNGVTTVQNVANSNIKYAPFSLNDELFPLHADKMVVINGIDTQTNAHRAGVTNTWTGRIARGYPTFPTLVAAQLGQGLPLAFISNGGFRETHNLVPITLLDNPGTLANLLNINKNDQYGINRLTAESQLDIVRQAQLARLNRLEGQSPKENNSISQFVSAINDQGMIGQMQSFIPTNESGQAEFLDNNSWGYYNPMLPQVQMSMAACAAGLTATVDLVCGGFDTHADNDNGQTIRLRQLIDGINFLWQEADRIEQTVPGFKNRIHLVVSSDFGRTPGYNDSNGKDHHPITSTLLMKAGESWTNKVIGATDDLHNPLSVNNVIMKPAHVQQMLRRWAGVENSPIANKYPLASQDLDLFNLVTA